MNSLSCSYIIHMLDSNNTQMNEWMKNESPFACWYVTHMQDVNKPEGIDG